MPMLRFRRIFEMGFDRNPGSLSDWRECPPQRSLGQLAHRVGSCKRRVVLTGRSNCVACRCMPAHLWEPACRRTTLESFAREARSHNGTLRLPCRSTPCGRPSAAKAGQAKPVSRSDRPSAAKAGQAKPVSRSDRPSAAKAGQAKPVSRSDRPSAAKAGQAKPVSRSDRPSVAKAGQAKPVSRSDRPSVAKPLSRSDRPSAANACRVRAIASHIRPAASQISTENHA